MVPFCFICSPLWNKTMRPFRLNLLILVTSYLLRPAVATAAVWTYPSPNDEFTSPHYEVTVIQDGIRHPSFTYVHHHQDPHLLDRMSDTNHWTTFSFDGEVTVEIKVTGFETTGTEIRPLRREIKPNTSANTVRFTLSEPGQFWVKIPGTEDHPLFIFADPPEENIPHRNDPDVIWFEAGKIHEIGERYLIEEGQTVYIEGGAYVIGSIAAESQSNITVRGRGILSGYGYPRRPGPQSIPYNTIMFNGPGDNQLVEGITITNPTHFCVLSRGELITRRVKLFGFWHQTDGWGGGPGSVVEDSFMKVNDDNVKLYNPNQIARRLVLYQQVNGAPFQLGWGGAGQRATDVLVEDIDIIACEASHKTTDERNQAILNLRNQNAASTIDGVTLRRVFIDSDIAMLIGLTRVKGTVRNLHLEDVHVRGPMNGRHFITTEDDGNVTGITFDRVTINGRVPIIVSDSAHWSLTGENINLTP